MDHIRSIVGNVSAGNHSIGPRYGWHTCSWNDPRVLTKTRLKDWEATPKNRVDTCKDMVDLAGFGGVLMNFQNL